MRTASLWSTTVGKQIVMAVSGLLMVGFVLSHMAGDLQLCEGAAGRRPSSSF